MVYQNRDFSSHDSFMYDTQGDCQKGWCSKYGLPMCKGHLVKMERFGKVCKVLEVNPKDYIDFKRSKQTRQQDRRR